MTMRLFSLACLLLSCSRLEAADWPAFRGPSGSGIAPERQAPLEWGPDENITWRATLPGPANSSPIVCRGRVFVTAAMDDGAKRGLYCYDAASGDELWSQIVEFAGEELTHKTNPYCGSTPATDGERIFVWHGTPGLFCYDFDGNELWSRELGKLRHIWGYGSSPVLYEDTVLLHFGPGSRTFLAAYDVASGETRWRIDIKGGQVGDTEDASGRPLWIGSWSTPTLTNVNGQDQILLSLPGYVQAFNPKDGALLWSCSGMSELAYTSVLADGEIGVAMSGYHGPAMGFRLGGSGDMTGENRLWHDTSRQPQRIGSGVLLDGHVYMVNENGVVQCIEALTGNELWKDRLPGVSIWASPIAVGDRIYVTDQDGSTFVFAARADRLELLAANRIGESSNSTLALADGKLYLRTSKSLLCLGDESD